MKLSHKLPLAFGASALALMAAALIGMIQLNGALLAYENGVTAHHDNERRAAHLLTQFKVQVQEWKNILLRGQDPKLLDRYWSEFEKNEADIRTRTRELQVALPADEPQAHALIDKFARAHTEMGAAYRRGLDTFKSSNFDARVGDRAVQGIDREAAATLEESVQLLSKSGQDMAEKARLASRRAWVVSVATMLLVCAVILGASVVFSHRVVRALAQAVQVSQAVAHGDLTAVTAVSGNDEISDLLNALHRMQTGLGRVVAHMRESAAEVAHSAAEISDSGTDLSQRTEQAAASLEEAAASMEQLGASVMLNAEHTRETSRLANEASRLAGGSGAVAGDMVDTMKGISEASTKISEITSVIDGIAFQTNILALNAAVEAARAGEQGRGFAVVASEVRSLALRAAEAAREIKSLISTNAQRVQTGSELVEKAGESMASVVDAIERVSQTLGSISAANAEQSASVRQIGEAVTQIDQNTQRNAALVEESAAAAESLKRRAEDMLTEVEAFRLPDDIDQSSTFERAPAAPQVLRAQADDSADVERVSTPARLHLVG